jgi:hypothetical protein
MIQWSKSVTSSNIYLNKSVTDWLTKAICPTTTFHVANEKASIFFDCEQTTGERAIRFRGWRPPATSNMYTSKLLLPRVQIHIHFIIIIKPCHSSNKDLHGLGTPLFHTYCRWNQIMLTERMAWTNERRLRKPLSKHVVEYGIALRDSE